MLKIGLTGGIGSGKSTVADLFREEHIPIIDADSIARNILDVGTEGYCQVIEKFGAEIILSNKELDRRLIREKVFKNPALLQWLNQCTHPKVRAEINRQVSETKSPYVILDIPLLFENKLEPTVDRVLVVDVPQELQLERVLQRDDSSAETIESIMKQQVSRDYRLAHADDIIDNSQNLEKLKRQVKHFHQLYLTMAEDAN